MKWCYNFHDVLIESFLSPFFTQVCGTFFWIVRNSYSAMLYVYKKEMFLQLWLKTQLWSKCALVTVFKTINNPCLTKKYTDKWRWLFVIIDTKTPVPRKCIKNKERNFNILNYWISRQIMLINIIFLHNKSNFFFVDFILWKIFNF